MEEASEMLEEPLEPVSAVKQEERNYRALSHAELMEEKKKFKTHKQKDEFIQRLIDALASSDATVSKPEAKTTEKSAMPAGAFVVEDVSKFKRSKDGVEQVLVKWKDYPIEEMTWENKTDELTRSNVGGSFFQASDTSYKKFCERVGLTNTQSCASIESKDKENCKKRNAKKTADEKSEDCSAEAVMIDQDEDEPDVMDDDSPSNDDDSAASAAATAASISAAAASSPSTASAAESTEEAKDAAAESMTEEAKDAATEASTEAATEASTEAATEASTEASTEAATEAATEASTEAATEASTESATDAVESLAETVAATLSE